MREYFLDSGYLVALELRRDQNHSLARKHWDKLKEALPRLITTDYVFDEVVTYFNNRGWNAKAVQLGQSLMESPSISLIHVDEDLFAESWRYFQQHDDKTFSLTDCISFVVMRKLGLTTALTFDKHFRQAGFQTEPRSETP